MEMSPVEIRQSGQSGFEAELRGDAPMSGDRVYWVGPTEAEARANLTAALGDLQRNIADFVRNEVAQSVGSGHLLGPRADPNFGSCAISTQ